MFVINEVINSQIEVKKSKFLATLAPFCYFDELNKALRGEHPKAAHVVWAYRYINEFSQIVENSSDDGEPKGSSAPAVLNALRGAGLVNTACLVVRYFGGVKLGIGGLVRAYGASANDAIKGANLIFYEKKEELKINLPFALISRFEHFIKSLNIAFKQDFSTLGCDFILSVNDDEKAKIQAFLKELGIF